MQNVLEILMTCLLMPKITIYQVCSFYHLCDFEKVFNSVSFEFIMTTLDIFNFGEHFKCWITILLGMEEGKNVNAVTVINGNISTPFKIH